MRMSRRSLTLLIASIGTAAAIGVAVIVPVPYVILSPGPTLNTLGEDNNGKPLITITGHATYPTTGHLNMVTVSYAGGPGANVNIFSALTAWLNPHDAVVPESELFPSGQSQQQTQQQNTAEMTDSQQLAVAAALTELHIPFQQRNSIAVAGTVTGYPAASVLQTGDVINDIDGHPISTTAGLEAQVRAHPAGTALDLTITRSGKVQHVSVATKEYQGHPILGIQPGNMEQFKFPLTVNISVGDIGGPSAGMMFALAIIDKLTSDNLAGGRFIAGTGEIAENGAVSPIGGIQQKMVGARDAGATVFLAPAANCGDTKGAVPSGLQVVKVSTLQQAITYLDDIKAGKPVPSC
jgi:PDZ domain-containing protein